MPALNKPDADSYRMLVLFQCARCKRVVGDSRDWLCAVPELSLAVLAHVPPQSVDLGDEVLEVSDANAPDCGSTFREIKCLDCAAVLGRFYKVARGIDLIRPQAYAFNVDEMCFYQMDGQVTETDIKVSSQPDLELADRVEKLERLVLLLYTNQTTAKDTDASQHS